MEDSEGNLEVITNCDEGKNFWGFTGDIISIPDRALQFLLGSLSDLGICNDKVYTCCVEDIEFFYNLFKAESVDSLKFLENSKFKIFSQFRPNYLPDPLTRGGYNFLDIILDSISLKKRLDEGLPLQTSLTEITSTRKSIHKLLCSSQFKIREIKKTIESSSSTYDAVKLKESKILEPQTLSMIKYLLNNIGKNTNELCNLLLDYVKILQTEKFREICDLTNILLLGGYKVGAQITPAIINAYMNYPKPKFVFKKPEHVEYYLRVMPNRFDPTELEKVLGSENNNNNHIYAFFDFLTSGGNSGSVEIAPVNEVVVVPDDKVDVATVNEVVVVPDDKVDEVDDDPYYDAQEGETPVVINQAHEGETPVVINQAHEGLTPDVNNILESYNSTVTKNNSICCKTNIFLFFDMLSSTNINLVNGISFEDLIKKKKEMGDELYNAMASNSYNIDSFDNWLKEQTPANLQKISSFMSSFNDLFNSLNSVDYANIVRIAQTPTEQTQTSQTPETKKRRWWWPFGGKSKRRKMKNPKKVKNTRKKIKNLKKMKNTRKQKIRKTKK
uniref:Uncharacterized protein n=1 Tax=viral metagenome TaxID=1070528 RepID=A0A6C0HT11_9ZZZZ